MNIAAAKEAKRAQTERDTRQVIDTTGGVWGLAIEGINIAETIKDSKAGLQEIKNKLHKRGLIYPGENRDGLIRSGAVPFEYSRGTIIETLRDGRLPAGWTVGNARQQGFAEWSDIGREKNLDSCKNTHNYGPWSLLPSQQARHRQEA